jgi:hypothetical protein
VAIGAPIPKKTPEFLARLTIKDSRQLNQLLSSIQTSSAKFQKTYPAWTPMYPSFAQGAAQIRQFWQAVPQVSHLVKSEK